MSEIIFRKINEFYVIYKSLPSMAESRFLEAPLVRQADGELKEYYQIFKILEVINWATHLLGKI